MKIFSRNRILLLSAVLVLIPVLSGCGNNPEETASNAGTQSSSFHENSKTESAKDENSFVNESKDNSACEESSPELSEESKTEDLSPEEQIKLLADYLANVPFYKSEIVGEVKASFYTQKIHDTRIKCKDESYLLAISNSALVNVGKEAFFSGDKVVQRVADDVKNNKWPEKFRVLTKSDYCAAEGNTPTELSNYIISEDTILEAKTQKKANGTFVLKIKINPESGTRRYAAKMMNYGGLSELPVFSECRVEICFNADRTINYLKSFDTYKIKIIGMSMQCKSELTETFDYSGDVKIPDVEKFRAVLNS